MKGNAELYHAIAKPAPPIPHQANALALKQTGWNFIPHSVNLQPLMAHLLEQ